MTPHDLHPVDDEAPEDAELADEGDGAADPGHLPVLLGQVIQSLEPRPGLTYLDCTLGRGGHMGAIAPLLGASGRAIGLDVDPANLEFSRQRLQAISGSPPFSLVRSNFSQARAVLASLDIPGVDLLLADLGFASSQMTDPMRGLSFNMDGPLDMRLDPELPTTAADLVNDLPQEELADVIYEFGQERLSRKIARKIVEERSASPILTTSRLAEVVRRAYGRAGGASGGRKRGKRIDPATRTFMALRIAVNGELDALRLLLDDLPRLLNPGGRVAIISFHSLEDRPVKRRFLELQQNGAGERLKRKPLTASDQERLENPRSRSAKLRAFRFNERSGPARTA